jgi:tripartite-type tricarboxylate transporter receptor subunit TctC
VILNSVSAIKRRTAVQHFIRSIFLVATLSAMSAAWSQQEAYPSKPLKFIVPFATGSGIDQLARTYAELLRTPLNQSIVVENREGAAGIIGAASVAGAAPDGYTVLVAAHPPFAIATQLQPKPSFDPTASFAPVARVGAVAMIAIAASSLPYRNWQEMSAYFRANPEKANYAVSGTGSPGQLFTQLIKLQTGLSMQEISYKSTGQALTDALAGQVQLSIVSYPAAAGHIKAGTLRLLGVGSSQRLSAYLDTPTLAELIGQPGFEAIVWYGFLMPAGTPADRVNRLYTEIEKASASPRVLEFMTKSSITPALQNPRAFAESIRNDFALASKMITAAKLRPE